MSAKMFLIIYSCILGISNSVPAHSYDQRQNGDLNVQVDLKDLRIIALLKSGKEEYVDYDYAYDYSEMTIKPQNGTTPKPLNGSNIMPGDHATNTSAADVVTEQTMPLSQNNSQMNEETTSSSINEALTTIQNIEEIATVAPQNLSSEASTSRPMTSTSRPMTSTSAVCKKGFVLNQKGDCELKMQGAGNALLKLVKLSQKLKLRRENRGSADSSI